MKIVVLMITVCWFAKLEANVNVQMAFPTLTKANFEKGVEEVITFSTPKKDIQYRFFSNTEIGHEITLSFPAMANDSAYSYYQYKVYLSEGPLIKDATDIYDGKITALINLDKSPWIDGSGQSGASKNNGDIKFTINNLKVPERSGFFGAVVIRPRYAKYNDFYLIVFYKK